jgi:general secretion pathway protein C
MALMDGVSFKHPLNSDHQARLRLMLTWFKRNQVASSRAIAFLLLVACAWMVGAMLWLPLSSTAIVPWQASISEVNLGSTSRVDIESIKQGNLFGASAASTVAVTPTIKEAPKTTLSLTLVGVVVTEPQSLSLAIIANRDQQATYGINESIEGTRAKVSAVYNDRVVLDNAGRSETLMLLDIATHSSSSDPTSSNKSKDKPDVANNEALPLSEENLVGIKQQISDDPSQLVQYVKMSKVKRDGSAVGYQLRPGRSPELFESLGLKNGDIATEVNGIVLSDADAEIQLMSLMDELTELNLTVERDGQPYEIYIQL